MCILSQIKKPSRSYSNGLSLPVRSKEIDSEEEELSPVIEYFSKIPKKDPAGFYIIRDSIEKIIDIEKKGFSETLLDDSISNDVSLCFIKAVAYREFFKRGEACDHNQICLMRKYI